MSELKIGAKVEYLQGDKWLKGIVHGIKKYDDKNMQPVVMGYLVDTGKDESVEEILTPKGEDNVIVRQPEQVEVTPDNIRPAK